MTAKFRTSYLRPTHGIHFWWGTVGLTQKKWIMYKRLKAAGF